MHKLLQVLVCGLAAMAFSAVAADEKKNGDADTKVQAKAKAKAGAGGTKADAKTETKADIKPDAAPAPEKVDTHKK